MTGEHSADDLQRSSKPAAHPIAIPSSHAQDCRPSARHPFPRSFSRLARDGPVSVVLYAGIAMSMPALPTASLVSFLNSCGKDERPRSRCNSWAATGRDANCDSNCKMRICATRTERRCAPQRLRRNRIARGMLGTTSLSADYCPAHPSDPSRVNFILATDR